MWIPAPKIALILIISIPVSISAQAESSATLNETRPVCPQDYELPVPGNVIGIKEQDGLSERQLSRSATGDGLNLSRTAFYSTPLGSNYWATQCPVFLGQRKPHSGTACSYKRIFSRSSALSIKAAEDGLFSVQIANVTIDNTPVNPDFGLFRAIDISGPAGEKQIGWLESERKTAGFDFYIFLQVTPTNLPGHPRGYKAYRVEAFPPEGVEENCDTHRPDQALCAIQEDGQHLCASSPTDSAELPERTSHQLSLPNNSRPTEADTGGGHEPPPAVRLSP